MSEILPCVESVEVLRVRPGDVLVVTLPEGTPKLTAAQMESFTDTFRERFPDNEILVLGGGIEVSVGKVADDA